MKNMKYSLFFVAGLLLLASCNNIFDPPSPIARGRVNIIITNEDTGRTVLPPAPDDSLTYKYFFKEGGNAEAEKQKEGDGSFALDPGSYTVRVEAYKDSVKSAVGTSDSFTVTATSHDTIQVKLKANPSGGNGTFSYTIIYPKDADFEITLKKGTDDSSVTITPVIGMEGDNNIRSGNVSLAPGSYVMTYKVTRYQNYIGLVEAIHIFPALTTTYTKTFTVDALIQKEHTYKVEFYKNEDPSNDLTPETTKTVQYPAQKTLVSGFPSDPTHSDGLIFQGWFDTSANTNGNEFKSDTDVSGFISEPDDATTSIIKVYARWAGKETGAAITGFAPTFTGISSTGFTINNAASTPTLNPSTGQTIEYAYGTSTTAPSTGWQDSETFTVPTLTNGTYYIFARAKESETHSAGAPVTAANTIIIESSMMTFLSALSTNCTYDGKKITVTGGTTTLASAVTIPSGVELVIKGTLKINNEDEGLTLNGTMTIDGGTFEIVKNVTPIEQALKGSGTSLTVKGNGTLVFPTTGTITTMLSGLTACNIIIEADGQLSMNRVMSDDPTHNYPTFIDANPAVKYIGQDGFFKIDSGTFEIKCYGSEPQIKIPSGSKVTVSKDTDSSDALGGGKTVPLNNNLTLEGELVIADGCALAIFTISSDTISKATLTNNGTIWLGTGSTLRISKKNGVDGQNPGEYSASPTGNIYKGTTGTTSATEDNSGADWITWTNP